jgi:hypothetical protein
MHTHSPTCYTFFDITFMRNDGITGLDVLSRLPRCGVACNWQATLLPNGDALLAAGMQTGCCGNPQYGVMVGDIGSLWPVLYQPNRPAGSRVTLLNASRIARIWHDSGARLCYKQTPSCLC